MKRQEEERNRGITLIALVITIIVLLILASVSIAMLTGENGLLTRANDAKASTEEAKVKDIVDLALLEWQTRKYTDGTEILDFLNEKVTKGEFDAVTDNENGTYTIEVEGYEVIVDSDGNRVGEPEVGGVRAKIEGNLYQTGGAALVEGTKYAEIVLTVKVTNKDAIGSIDKIEVTKPDGSEIEKNATVVGEGEGSYKIKGNGTYTVKVTTTTDGVQKTATKQITIKGKVQVAEFTRKFGEMDIQFLKDSNNTVASSANAPVLGKNMTPVNFNEATNKWEEVAQSSWNYSYQNTAGKSEWANAVVKDESGNVTGYFVWIPRYAYKITYYGEAEHTNIVGYSDSRGIVHADGNEVMSATNRRRVGENYIVHPAFMNDVTVGGWNKELPGIWVAKYEASGNTSTGVKVLPAISSWRSIKVGDCYTQSEKYNEALNSHLIKNSEWGATAYLSYSNYGLGWQTPVEKNTSSSYLTGGASSEETIYTTNKGQSTTGNAYGVYDMNGGAWEYVASYVNNGNANIDNGSSFATKEKASASSTEKATVYEADTSDSQSKNYSLSGEMMYGDATYETSISHSNATGSWHDAYAGFPFGSYPFFTRSGLYAYDFAGTFYFDHNVGTAYSDVSFRPVLCP